MASQQAVHRAVVLSVVLLFAPAVGWAHGVANTFDQLHLLIGPGDTVRITQLDGQEVKGIVNGLSDSSLTLVVDGSSRTFRESDIVRIRQRKYDNLANGARNGFFVGAGFGLLAVLAMQSEVRSAAFIPYAVGVYGGLGAGIGAGVGAMIPTQRTIYAPGRKRSAAAIAVAPALGHERKGIVVSLGF